MVIIILSVLIHQVRTIITHQTNNKHLVQKINALQQTNQSKIQALYNSNFLVSLISKTLDTTPAIIPNGDTLTHIYKTPLSTQNIHNILSLCKNFQNSIHIIEFNTLSNTFKLISK